MVSVGSSTSVVYFIMILMLASCVLCLLHGVTVGAAHQRIQRNIVGSRSPQKGHLLELHRPSYLRKPQQSKAEVEVSNVVRTTQGLIMGRRETKGFRTPILAFRGVPYAAPPIGRLRLQSPQRHPPWQGIRMAMEYRAGCLSYIFNFAVGEEDCLYLNVFVPQQEDVSRDSNGQTKAMPVAFWIHGGGLTLGSELIPILYRPTTFTDRGVIFVSVSYRLGTLGFLSNDDAVLPGNFGAKDVSMALRWIHQNIRAFGGDPSQIHVFGQSSGALLVQALSLSPTTQGLMRTAVQMSGSMVMTLATNSCGRPMAKTVAKWLDCPWQSSTPMLKCFRQRGAKELTKAISAFEFNGFKYVGPFTAIVIDHYAKDPFMPYHPLEIIRSKNYQPVPSIFGTVNNEWNPIAAGYLFNKNFHDMLVKEWDKNCMKLLHGFQSLPNVVPFEEDSFYLCRRARKLFLEEGSSTGPNIDDAIIMVFGEMAIVAPTYIAAMLHAKYTNAPVYYYSFEHSNEAVPRLSDLVQAIVDWKLFPLLLATNATYRETSFRREQGHADELIPLFGLQGGPPTSLADGVAGGLLASGLVSFWKSSRSKPELSSRNSSWPEFTTDSQEYLVITGNGPSMAKNRVSQEKLELYVDWYDAYVRRGFSTCRHKYNGWFHGTTVPSLRKMLLRANV